MKTLKNLFDRNLAWAAAIREKDPDFFSDLSRQPEKLAGLDPDEKLDLLCELNVKEQVVNVCNTTVVQKAWKTGAELSVHGWIYNIENGILKDLDNCITSRQ